MFFRDELNDKAFIIAEVGQNHQGDFDLALKYIDKFSELGADAIKFQTRDINYLFDEGAIQKEYNSPTAFGRTYGDHRKFLEFDKTQVFKLKQHCERRGVIFMSTPFDEPSLDFLCEIGTEVLKVASFDIGNLPFLNKLKRTEKPIVLSVGGGQDLHIRSSMELLKESDVALLHCVSEYPCEYDRLGLSSISELRTLYPSVSVGLSDHFNGTLSGPIAFLAGARVFEKHVTFNRAWKGTDHPFALEAKGFETFVRDIRRVPKMFNKKPSEEVGTEPVFQKLGKSIVAATNIKSGSLLSLDNLTGRILTNIEIPVRDSHKIIGSKIKRDYERFEPIFWEDIF